jgi:hypothetical protein
LFCFFIFCPYKITRVKYCSVCKLLIRHSDELVKNKGYFFHSFKQQTLKEHLYYSTGLLDLGGGGSELIRKIFQLVTYCVIGNSKTQRLK